MLHYVKIDFFSHIMVCARETLRYTYDTHRAFKPLRRNDKKALWDFPGSGRRGFWTQGDAVLRVLWRMRREEVVQRYALTVARQNRMRQLGREEDLSMVGEAERCSNELRTLRL